MSIVAQLILLQLIKYSFECNDINSDSTTTTTELTTIAQIDNTIICVSINYINETNPSFLSNIDIDCSTVLYTNEYNQSYNGLLFGRRVCNNDNISKPNTTTNRITTRATTKSKQTKSGDKSKFSTTKQQQFFLGDG